jgi:hypothetical protein
VSFWQGLFGREEPRPGPTAPQPPPDQQHAPAPAEQPSGPASGTVDDLERRLDDIVRRVKRAGGTMPEGGVPAARDVEDVLRPLLRYLRSNPPTAAELIPVRAMVTDYLPSTLDTFLALPPQFAATHRGRTGRTPAEDLLEQLRLLAEGATETATAIYAGDAQKLSDQGRFLATKFTRSDLDL